MQQPEPRAHDVPLWRLYVLRATYGIFVIPALVMAPFLSPAERWR